MKLYLICAFLFLLGVCEIKSQTTQTYKAAVVEYSPLRGLSGQDRMLENAAEYLKYIQQAKDKGATIIVFPEYGLTYVDVLENLDDYSVIIPDPKESISPCMVQQSYSKVLVDLSCAATQHGIYVIANVLEKSVNASNSTVFYNTNIVFDKNGGIIARYRKINLYKEPGLTPGNELVTFKADIGVTFGIFTCYDLVHKNPAQEILKELNVTDIIYPTAWLSELPFGVSLSAQAGYSKANNVNLLAAGLSNPKKSIGGSGIYAAQGSSEIYISALTASTLLFKDVSSTIPRNTKVCDASISPPSPRGIGGSIGGNVNISDFVTNEEDMKNYTFKSLSGKNTYETICTGGDSFCCTFNITILEETDVSGDYVYKLASFYGVRDTGESTIGVRTCALVACQTNDTKTCGKRIRNAPAKTKFGKIEISGTFTKSDDTYEMPSTLLTNLEPSKNLAYCAESASGGKVKVTVASPNPVDSVLTFGIYGRLYKYDNQEAGSRNSAITFSPTVLVVLLMSLLVLRN